MRLDDKRIMTDFQSLLAKLHQNMNILQEREAKHGGNAPVELLNQISDHQEAIALTEQARRGELGEVDWREALKPLLVAIDSRSGEAATGVTIGNIEGGIHGSIIAGHDVQFVLQIGQQTGVPIPQTRNLPAQLAALQQALLHLTHPAEKAATQAIIEKLQQAIAGLPQHEQHYRDRLKERYAKLTSTFVELISETSAKPELNETEPDEFDLADLSQIMDGIEDLAELREWKVEGREIQRIKLNSLREGVDKYDCIILLGDPGSGKTTALENLAYQLAREPHPPTPSPLRRGGESPLPDTGRGPEGVGDETKANLSANKPDTGSKRDLLSLLPTPCFVWQECRV